MKKKLILMCSMLLMVVVAAKAGAATSWGDGTGDSWSSPTSGTYYSGSTISLRGLTITLGSSDNSSVSWEWNSGNKGLVPSQMPSTDGTSGTLITTFSETSPFGTLPTKGCFLKVVPTMNGTFSVTCKPSTDGAQKVVLVTMDAENPSMIAAASVKDTNKSPYSYELTAGRTYYFFQLAKSGKLSSYRFTLQGISFHIPQVNDDASALSWTSSSSTNTINTGDYVQLDGLKMTFGNPSDANTNWTWNGSNSGMIPSQMPNTDGTSATLITSFSETSPFGTLPTHGNFFKIETTKKGTLTITSKPSNEDVQKFVFVTMDSSDPTVIASAQVSDRANSIDYNVQANRTYYFFQLAKSGELTSYRFTLKGISFAEPAPYETDIAIADLIDGGSKDITINTYPLNDNWGTHDMGSYDVDDILTALGIASITKDIVYAKHDANTITSSKSASSGNGFWLQKSGTGSGEFFATSDANHSDRRIFINVNNLYDSETTKINVSMGQKPSSCAVAEYTVSIYVLAPRDENDKWKAYTINLTFNLQPSVISENASYALEQTGITALKLQRTLKANKWNTIVLPVALTNAQLQGAFGENVKVAELTGASVGELTFNSVTTTAANQPYMIYVDQDFSEATFNGVTINVQTPTQTVSSADFVGSYAAETSIPTGAYFVKDNYLVKAADTTNKMRGTRAYFNVPAAGSVKSLGIIIDGDEATGIEAIENGKLKMENSEIYNLAGQKMNRLQKGINIVNGKKVAVK